MIVSLNDTTLNNGLELITVTMLNLVSGGETDDGMSERRDDRTEPDGGGV